MATEVDIIDLSSDEDVNAASKGCRNEVESMDFQDTDEIRLIATPLLTQSKPKDTNTRIFVAANSVIFPVDEIAISDNSSDSQPNGLIRREHDMSSLSSSSLVNSPCPSPSSSTKDKIKGGVNHKSRQFEKGSRKRKKKDKYNLLPKRIKPTRCDTTKEIHNGSSNFSSTILPFDAMKNGESTSDYANEKLSAENPLQSFINVLKVLRDKVNEYISDRNVSDLYDQMCKCRTSFLISEDFKTTVEENIEHVNHYIDSVQACMFQTVENLHHHQANNSCDCPQKLKKLVAAELRTPIRPFLKHSVQPQSPKSNSEISSDIKTSTFNESSLSFDTNAQKSSSSGHVEPSFVPHIAQTARKSFPSPSVPHIEANHSLEDEVVEPETLEDKEDEPETLKDKEDEPEALEDMEDDPETLEDKKEEPETLIDKERQKRIAKLDKLLFKICKRIRELREQEVLSEDDENSAYIREDRMCKKMISVCRMLWKENDSRFLTGRPIEKKIHYQSTKYPEINVRIERLVNKMKLFPDFRDVHLLITRTNEDFNLDIPNVDDLARAVFKEIGEKLQKQRIDTYLQHFMEMMEDAGEYQEITDENFVKKLEESRQNREQKIIEVIDHYASLDSKHVEESDSKEKSNSDIENENDDDETEDSNEENEVSAAESDDIEILEDEISVGLNC